MDQADTSEGGITGYQRKVKPRVIKMIEESYKPTALGAPILAERKDGRLHCEDGQQRITWLLGKGVIWFGCLVAKSTGQQDEADTFVKINSGRQAVTPMEVFHAEVAAGDHVARSIQMALHAQGFWIAGGVQPQNGFKDGGALTCIKAVKFVYRLGGRALIEDSLSLIATAWNKPDQKRARGEFFLKAAGYFLAAYAHRGLDLEELARLLALEEPALLEKKAVNWNREEGVIFGGARWYGMAAQFHRIWNYRRKLHKLPHFKRPTADALIGSRYQPQSAHVILDR